MSGLKLMYFCDTDIFPPEIKAFPANELCLGQKCDVKWLLPTRYQKESKFTKKQHFNNSVDKKKGQYN